MPNSTPPPDHDPWIAVTPDDPPDPSTPGDPWCQRAPPGSPLWRCRFHSRPYSFDFHIATYSPYGRILSVPPKQGPCLGGIIMSPKQGPCLGCIITSPNEGSCLFVCFACLFVCKGGGCPSAPPFSLFCAFAPPAAHPPFPRSTHPRGWKTHFIFRYVTQPF